MTEEIQDDHMSEEEYFALVAETNMLLKGQPKVGRNDPCPWCQEVGKKIKFKKCEEHYYD